MDNNLQINQNAEQTYHSIRQSIVSAQHRLSAAVNSTMVITYWEIGEQIYKACGENDRTMFEAAGLAVAMGNADEEIKAMADDVTLSNDEDGVAAAIEKWVL